MTHVSKCCRAALYPEPAKDGEGDILICAVCRKPAATQEIAIEVQLASNEELISELMSRFSHGVFAAIKPVDESVATKEYKNLTYRRWMGNSLVATGLCFETAQIITKDYLERRVDCDDVGRSID